MQDHFSIATGLKAGAGRFQFQPQLAVIEDLAVKNHNHIAVRTDERLIAGFQIKDAQPRGPSETRSVEKPRCWSGPRCVRDLSAASNTPRGRRLRTCVYPRMPHMDVLLSSGRRM